MNGVDSGRFRVLLGFFLLFVVAGGVVDLVLDHRGDRLTLHIVYEMITVLTALGLGLMVWSGWWRTERSVRHLQSVLKTRSDERDQWQAQAQRALEGFSVAVDEQFRAWELTPAEREVAFLILKGNTHKQVAQATGRSDRTARQHAGMVYQKAGLSSRAELAAYFMKDVRMPEELRGEELGCPVEDDAVEVGAGRSGGGVGIVEKAGAGARVRSG